MASIQSAEKVDSSDNKDTQESSSDSDGETGSSKSLPLKGEELNNNKSKVPAAGASAESGSVENMSMPGSEGSVRSGSVESSSKDTGNELDMTNDVDNKESDVVFPPNEVEKADGDGNDLSTPDGENSSNNQNDLNLVNKLDDEASVDEEDEIFDAAELRAEIETIIKERIMEHFLNEEVANITEGSDEKLIKEKLESLDKKVEGYLTQYVSSATAEGGSTQAQTEVCLYLYWARAGLSKFCRSVSRKIYNNMSL